PASRARLATCGSTASARWSRYAIASSSNCPVDRRAAVANALCARISRLDSVNRQRQVRTVDIEQARFNMIEQQIRPWDVLDPVVLDILRQTPRERFVPQDHRDLAFADMQIPIGPGEVMREPKVEARLSLELGGVGGEELEVGTASDSLTVLSALV